jgi:hypothetical protein
MYVIDHKKRAIMHFLETQSELVHAFRSFGRSIKEHEIQVFHLCKGQFQGVVVFFVRVVSDAFAGGFRTGIDHVLGFDAGAVANLQHGVGLMILNNSKNHPLQMMGFFLLKFVEPMDLFFMVDCLQRFEGIIGTFGIQHHGYEPK